MSTIGPKNPSLPRLDKADVAKGASQAEGPAAKGGLAKGASRAVDRKVDTFEKAQSTRVGDLLGGKAGTPEAPLEGGGSLRLEGPLGGAAAESPLNLKGLDGGAVQAGPTAKDGGKSSVRDLLQGSGKLRLEDFDLETLEKYKPTITTEDYEARRQELQKAAIERKDAVEQKARLEQKEAIERKHAIEQKARLEQKDAIEQKALGDKALAFDKANVERQR
jgi:hypothetical protein